MKGSGCLIKYIVLKPTPLKPRALDYDNVIHLGCELSGNKTSNPYNFCKRTSNKRYFGALEPPLSP